MEGFLVFLFFCGAFGLIFGGALELNIISFLGFVLIVISTLTSVATGKGSSFGPNATHSNKFPYRRK